MVRASYKAIQQSLNSCFFPFMSFSLPNRGIQNHSINLCPELRAGTFSFFSKEGSKATTRGQASLPPIRWGPEGVGVGAFACFSLPCTLPQVYKMAEIGYKLRKALHNLAP